MSHHKKNRINLRSIYQWHRYAGLVAALFIIIIAVTGIMINHSSRLTLNSTYVKSDWLLNFYGIKAPDKVQSYSLKNNWLSQWKNQIYLNTHFIHKERQTILGAITYADIIIVALADALLVFTEDGELIERVAGSEGVPSGIEAIGLSDKNQLAIRASNGVFTGNKDLLFWQAAPSSIIVWSDVSPLPKQLYATMLDKYRGRGLKLERVIFDLHSGRIVGSWGIFFTDVVAILMIFLSISGIWLWIMRTIKSKKHKHHKTK